MPFKAAFKAYLRCGMLLGLGATISLSASPGRRYLRLARKYHPGSRMVYSTEITTHITFRSHPSGLKSFLPDVPGVVIIRPQTTLTVESVRPDGSAEVKDHFDDFEMLASMADDPSGDASAQVQKVESAFSQKITGQTLTTLCSPSGRLVGFSGADTLLKQLQAPAARGAARCGLKLLLAQLGGYGFYPDRPVYVGEIWKRHASAKLSEAVPLLSRDEDAYRLESLIRYHGVRAAVIAFDLANSVHPARNTGASAGLFALLKAQGVTLDIEVSGGGHGTAIVALDDGRILQEDSLFHESFRGSLQGLHGVPLPANGPASLDLDTENAVHVIELAAGFSGRRPKSETRRSGGL